MDLFADRFVMQASAKNGYAFDLATNRSVWLRVTPSGDDERCRRWTVACDAAFRSIDESSPRLIDYGAIGQAEKFEAWSRAIGPLDVATDDTSADAGDLSCTQPVSQSAIAALAELFQAVDDRRGSIAALWGRDGSQLAMAVLLLSRLARIQGFVPVSAHALVRYRCELKGRSVFLIDDGALLLPHVRLTLESPLAHVCVALGPDERPGIHGVHVGSVPARWKRRDRHLARSALRVAEQPASYGESDDFGTRISDCGLASDAQKSTRRPRPCVGDGELATLRQRLEASSALLATGRHAPGLRLLRQTVGALARREAWAAATDGSLRLAAELMNRGCPKAALRALGEGAGYADRAGDARALLDVARLTGESWIDAARLDEAERVLSAALTGARSAADRSREMVLTTSLARCLFWRAEFTAAASCLMPNVGRPVSDEHAIRRLRVAAAIAAARAQPGTAIAALDEARALVRDRSELAADVEDTNAFVKLVIGDYDGVDRHVAACLSAARKTCYPIRAFSARLLQAEADRRRSRALPHGLARTLRRLASAAPPVLKARWDLLSALGSTVDAESAVSRQITQSGLKALSLFSATVVHTAGGLFDPVVRDVVSILEVCQHAEDATGLLREVCARVRQRLRAAGVALFAALGKDTTVIAADGIGIRPDVAQRALGIMATIAPARVAERIEAAALVAYGGRTIGVLCARWTIGTTEDLSRAGAVLSMAAVAAGPIVAAHQAQAPKPVARPAIELLGITPRMDALRRDIERAAAAPYPILIEGESGSGKELVARAIHRAGPRRDRPFAALNCAALPDDLVEAELFGHSRGAFTSAVADRPGVFEEAHGGVLFLDEAGELSLRAQAKLLRVIQEGELRRIGENLARRVDVRIVAATNRDLAREVEAGRFRVDLLYRLDVVRIVVPALRDHAEDIAVLVDHFWTEATRKVGSRATLAASACAALVSYSWPGNVRELQNVLAALAVRSPKRGVVPPSALPTHITAVHNTEAFRLLPARRAFEEAFVRAALVRTGGHRGHAAEELGVSRQGLTKLIARLDIE